MSADDVTLVRLFQTGDESAFAELYRRHLPAVARVCQARLRDPQLAEEAVQETFVRALSGLREYDCRLPVERWLRKVAKNHCIDVLRQRGREHPADEEEGVRLVHLLDPRAEQPFERIMARAALGSALRSLSERDRWLLVSRHVNGMSVDNLAQRSGMTPGAMAVALTRARTRARQRADRALVGLLPIVGWWRSRRASLQRFAMLDHPLALLYQSAVAQISLAIALCIPVLLPSGTVDIEMPVAPHPWSAWAPDPAGAVATRPPAAGEYRDAFARSGGDEPGRGAPVEVDIGSVPGTGLRVDPRMHGPPVVVYGTRLLGDDPMGNVTIEFYGSPPPEPADTLGCAVFDQAEPVTYCERP